jgi:hypothetical protein
MYLRKTSKGLYADKKVGKRFCTRSLPNFPKSQCSSHAKWQCSIKKEKMPSLSCTVQTADLSLPSIRQIPHLHSWIENKFMLRLLLCIPGLFLPHNFTLGFHYPGLEGDSDRIQSEEIRILWKNFLSFLVGMKHTHLTLFMHNGLLSQWRKGILNKF